MMNKKEAISTLKNSGLRAEPLKKRNNGKEHTWTVWIPAKRKKWSRQKLSSSKFKDDSIQWLYVKSNQSLQTIKRMYNAISNTL